MKVKSCPCCGSVEYVGIQAKFISNNLMYRVVCSDAFDGGSNKGCGLKTGWFLTIQEAVDRWNTRNLNGSETEVSTSTM